MRFVEVVRFDPPEATRQLNEWKAAHSTVLAGIPEHELVVDLGSAVEGGDFARIRVAEHHASLFEE
jgi:hypothetical protein